MPPQRKVALSSNAALIFNHGGRRMNKKSWPSVPAGPGAGQTAAVVQERETNENPPPVGWGQGGTIKDKEV